MQDLKKPFHFEVAGYVTISTDKRGKLAEFKNLITDVGLNFIVDVNCMRGAFVGTGSTPPTVADTALAAPLAYVDRVNYYATTQTSAPYYAGRITLYRFPAGTAAGNLTEIGIGWRTGTFPNFVTTLLSRTLIKDANGNPTSLTILSDEILEITYDFRYYIPTEDVTGSITFTGNIGGTYNYVIRPANISSINYINGWDTSNYTAHSSHVPGYSHGYGGGDLGPITGQPTGNHLGGVSNITTPAYVTNSYSSTQTYDIDTPAMNNASGITTFMLRLGVGCYQIKFTPAIPKTSLDSLSLTLQYSWSRRP